MSIITYYIHPYIYNPVPVISFVEKKKLDGQALLGSLQRGDQKSLELLYTLYRDEFLNWAVRHFKRLDRDDALDAWQESVIAFYDQVMSGKLTHLTCEVKTYLFIIGRRYLIKRFEKGKRVDLVDPIEGTWKLESESIIFEWDDPYAEQKDLIQNTMNKLGNPCTDLLVLKFADGYSIPEIMEKTGYPNVNTVSATLSRCLRKLKEMIHESLQTKVV